MVKSSIQVACIESQSIVVKDKQSYYHPLHVSVKAHCHSNSCFVCKWYSWKRLKGAMLLRSFQAVLKFSGAGCYVTIKVKSKYFQE